MYQKKDYPHGRKTKLPQDTIAWLKANDLDEMHKGAVKLATWLIKLKEPVTITDHEVIDQKSKLYLCLNTNKGISFKVNYFGDIYFGDKTIHEQNQLTSILNLPQKKRLAREWVGHN